MDGKKEERKGESKQERKTERPVEKFVFFRTKPRTGRIKWWVSMFINQASNEYVKWSFTFNQHELFTG